MCDRCHEGSSLSGRKLYNHLFAEHGYSKEDIEKIKKEKRDQRISSKTENTYICGECELIFSSKTSLKNHKSLKHRNYATEAVQRQITCPICMEEVKTHEHLVEHTQLAHAHERDEYRVNTLFFTDRNQYEAWRRNEEKEHILQWAKTSVTVAEDRRNSYFRCSRAVPFPAYALTQGMKSKKTVAYCTAFLRVSESDRGIAVTFCNKHSGHAEEPALLNIDEESEKYIVTLLREGFTSNQILKKIRMEFRSKKKQPRLYFTTAKDIRRIATRNNMEPGRKHAFDLQSVEMRINENSEDDGIQRYVHATNETGDGFLLSEGSVSSSVGFQPPHSTCLVVITPVQKLWLTRYSRRGISIDDTFNLTRYSLRLATVIVADEWDMGLPGAYLLSHRMTEHEVFELFSAIKKMVPDFDPKLFMTDDTNSFHNGFMRAFPQSAAVKLLCNFHILQAIKRNCKAKLVEKKHTGMVVGRVRSLCRLADRSEFTAKYSSLLTHLQQIGEQVFCSYMEDTWSHRVQQWGGFARQNACMNTSMLGERFHKRLKHELPESKPNMRLDRLLEILISLAADMEEDRNIKMQRGLLGGRYRLSQQHHQHGEAVKWFQDRQENVIIVGSGQWKVIEGGVNYRVQQLLCSCDSTLNNHCTKGDCGACGYGFRCDCENNVQSGVSCLHVHASLIYAPSGKITMGTSNQESVVSLELAETAASSASSSAMEARQSNTEILDSNKNLVHDIEAEISVIKSDVLKLVKIPDVEVNKCLENVLQSLKEVKCGTEDVLRLKLSTRTRKTQEIARRADLPVTGRLPRNPPIRKLLPRSCQRKKQDPSREPTLVPTYAPDDVNFCTVCFRRDPKEPSSEENTAWLKCDVCNRWAHEDCTGGEGSKCPLDNGVFRCSLVEEQ